MTARSRHGVWFVLMALLASLGAGLAGRRQARVQPRVEMPMKSVALAANWRDLDADCMTVRPGNSTEADNYYRLIEQPEHLGPRFGGSLDSLLKYLGWSNLTAETIEARLAPSFDEFGADAVAVEYFAPKTSHADGRGIALSYGWRKLIRLRTRHGSDADNQHIASAFILFNANTFTPSSGSALWDYIQVMLIPRADAPPDKFAAYWLVYRGRVENYNLNGFIVATFDGGDFGSTGASAPFWVPVSCAQCHGQDQNRAQLNLLDTDHWLDRIKAGDDFTAVAPGLVLPDAGANPASEEYRRTFDRLRTLNREILDQNRLAGAKAFRTKAAEQWLTLHATDNTHQPLEKRAFETRQGRGWTAAETTLLNQLNRYCYRCHSSIAFSVFDRPSVVAKKDHMADLVASGCMPRDRQLNESTRTDLEATLRALQ